MQTNVLHGQLMGGTLISWHSQGRETASTASAWNTGFEERTVPGTLLGV